ncbi:MAG: imidazole glycerol phosphate synthase subunit HisF [Actinobacteria bacterium]|nr:imidazole glycerol phosphate synthase subunit HisF [Actinomycetota bacterium]
MLTSVIEQPAHTGLCVRVIPCLDVSAGRVVKGVNFENLRDQGDPVSLASRYFHDGADELTFLDVSATVEDRETMYDVVERTAEQVFIPLTVGGGVRTVADVARLLSAGADKVSVNSAAVARPELLREISDRYGNQVLVLSLDVKRTSRHPSGFGVTSHGGRVETELDAREWATRAVSLGAGELLVNSIDADGTRQGFDLELIRLIRDAVDVPLIASGGAGSVGDFAPAVMSGADAVLAASIFHSGEVSITAVKQDMASHGLSVRNS